MNMASYHAAGARADTKLRFGRRYVLSRLQLPTRLPIWSSLVAWLTLDRLQAPGWVCGVVATLFAILWAVLIYSWWTEVPVASREIDLGGDGREP